MVKLLLTGASGLLGRSIFNTLTKCNRHDWIIEGWALNRLANGRYTKVDLTNSTEITDALKLFQPDIIIHAAAERRPDVVKANPEASRSLNVEATRILADFARSNDALIIYISTDYIFDGRSPPYSESSTPNPLNDYGLSKLESEKIIGEVCSDGRFVILRIPVLYGPVEYLGEGAIDILLKQLLDITTPVKMDNYQRRYPTHVDEISAAILVLIEAFLKDENSITGLYHWSGVEEMTKFDMVRILAAKYEKSMEHFSPVNTIDEHASASRPYNAKLTCERFVILRIPVLYGPVEYLGEGAIDILLKQLLDITTPIKMDNYQRRYPTHVDEIAAAILILIEAFLKDENSITGLYHWSGAEEMTKFDMVRILAAKYEKSMEHFSPVNTIDEHASASRPYNAKLTCERLLNLGMKNIILFENGCKTIWNV